MTLIKKFVRFMPGVLWKLTKHRCPTLTSGKLLLDVLNAVLYTKHSSNLNFKVNLASFSRDVRVEKSFHNAIIMLSESLKLKPLLIIESHQVGVSVYNLWLLSLEFSHKNRDISVTLRFYASNRLLCLSPFRYFSQHRFKDWGISFRYSLVLYSWCIFCHMIV